MIIIAVKAVRNRFVAHFTNAVVCGDIIDEGVILIALIAWNNRVDKGTIKAVC